MALHRLQPCPGDEYVICSFPVRLSRIRGAPLSQSSLLQTLRSGVLLGLHVDDNFGFLIGLDRHLLRSFAQHRMHDGKLM